MWPYCFSFSAACPPLLLALLRCLPFSAACSFPLLALLCCSPFRPLALLRCNDFESHLWLSGAILWLSWVILGSSWGHLVAILGHLGAILGNFGAILWSFSNSLERLGVKMRSKSTNIDFPKSFYHGFEWPMMTPSEKKCSQTL